MASDQRKAEEIADHCRSKREEWETWFPDPTSAVDVARRDLFTLLDRIAELTAEVERLRAKSLPAYHLSVGSFGTAKDLAVLLLVENPALAEEIKSLATNFERIAELLESEASE